MSNYHMFQLSLQFLIIPGISLLWRIERRLDHLQRKIRNCVTRDEFRSGRLYDYIDET